MGVAHLAIRTLIQAGRKKVVEELGSGLVDRAQLKAAEGKEGDAYGKVLNLVEHSDKLHPFDLFQYSITATLLTVFLEQRTQFFSPRSDDHDDLVSTFPGMIGLSPAVKDSAQIDEETSTFVGALVLKHILQLICNASAIYEVGSR